VNHWSGGKTNRHKSLHGTSRLRRPYCQPPRDLRQGVYREWFPEMASESRVPHFCRVGLRPGDGDQQCLSEAWILPQAVGKLETAHCWHLQVAENQIRLAAFQLLETVEPIDSHMDVGVHGHEKLSQGTAHAVIVVDDKNGTATEQCRRHHIMSHGNAPTRAAGSGLYYAAPRGRRGVTLRTPAGAGVSLSPSKVPILWRANVR
jgi:hypothetical protein